VAFRVLWVPLVGTKLAASAAHMVGVVGADSGAVPAQRRP
jgi:hypothetical protein